MAHIPSYKKPLIKLIPTYQSIGRQILYFQTTYHFTTLEKCLIFLIPTDQ